MTDELPQLGHIVLYVHDLPCSIDFYHHIVGLRVVGKIFNDKAAVLSGGRTHHELLLIEAGNAPGPLRGRRLGLYHVGWQVGEELAALRAARDRILTAGYTIDGTSDHTISQSLYLRDPDGNEVELFVNDSNYDWRQRTDWLEAPVKPLRL